MARYDHLPIWKDAVTLAGVLEEAVRRFPRYHKYALGTDLRRQAYAICRGVVVANGERERREQALDRLILANDPKLSHGRSYFVGARLVGRSPAIAQQVALHNGVSP